MLCGCFAGTLEICWGALGCPRCTFGTFGSTLGVLLECSWVLLGPRALLEAPKVVPTARGRAHTTPSNGLQRVIEVAKVLPTVRARACTGPSNSLLRAIEVPKVLPTARARAHIGLLTAYEG